MSQQTTDLPGEWIELTVTRKERKRFPVEFPIYSQLDLDNATIYMRRDANMTLVSVTVSDDETRFELEVKQRAPFDNSPIDYHLGLGSYTSSRQAFEEARAKLMEAAHG